MNEQTSKYISLKPISEKFNNVAKEISEEDIKSIIIGELKEQLHTINFGSCINEIIEDYIENNSYEINKLIKESIIRKFDK